MTWGDTGTRVVRCAKVVMTHKLSALINCVNTWPDNRPVVPVRGPGRPGGRGSAYAKSSRRHSPNIVVCAATSVAVVAGLISAMLWNGVSRMPRLRA